MEGTIVQRREAETSSLAYRTASVDRILDLMLESARRRGNPEEVQTRRESVKMQYKQEEAVSEQISDIFEQVPRQNVVNPSKAILTLKKQKKAKGKSRKCKSNPMQNQQTLQTYLHVTRWKDLPSPFHKKPKSTGFQTTLDRYFPQRMQEQAP